VRLAIATTDREARYGPAPRLQSAVGCARCPGALDERLGFVRVAPFNDDPYSDRWYAKRIS
jgi:hypothetical protein